MVVAFAFAPEMKLKRVSGNIYMVRGVDALPSLENRGFMSNAFGVLTKEGWVVDALSTPELSNGHNEPLKKDAMDDSLNYLTFLRERVKKMKEEDKSIDEIKQALAEDPFKDYKMYNEFHNANIFAVYNQLDYEED